MAEKVFRAEDRELYHHGIKGQKWGVRRFQNEDGSLTPAGKKRYFYGYEGEINNRKDYKKALKGAKETFKYNKNFMDKEFGSDSKPYKDYEKSVYKEGIKEIKDEYKKTDSYKARKEALIFGAEVAAGVLIGVGAYKLYEKHELNKSYKKGYEAGKLKVESLLKSSGVSSMKIQQTSAHPSPKSNAGMTSDEKRRKLEKQIRVLKEERASGSGGSGYEYYRETLSKLKDLQNELDKLNGHK